jgi:hypothetical protein
LILLQLEMIIIVGPMELYSRTIVKGKQGIDNMSRDHHSAIIRSFAGVAVLLDVRKAVFFQFIFNAFYLKNQGPSLQAEKTALLSPALNRRQDNLLSNITERPSSVEFLNIDIGELNEVSVMLKADGPFLGESRKTGILDYRFPVKNHCDPVAFGGDLEAVPLA